MGERLAVSDPLNVEVRIVDGAHNGFEVHVVAFVALLKAIFYLARSGYGMVLSALPCPRAVC